MFFKQSSNWILNKKFKTGRLSRILMYKLKTNISFSILRTIWSTFCLVKKNRVGSPFPSISAGPV